MNFTQTAINFFKLIVSDMTFRIFTSADYKCSLAHNCTIYSFFWETAMSFISHLSPNLLFFRLILSARKDKNLAHLFKILEANRYSQKEAQIIGSWRNGNPHTLTDTPF